MRFPVIFLLTLIMFVLAGSSIAEVYPEVIYDLPEEEIISIFGPERAASILHGGRSKAPETNFEGDTAKVLAILIHWNNRPASHGSE